jgi:hypothetical protein
MIRMRACIAEASAGPLIVGMKTTLSSKCPGAVQSRIAHSAASGCQQKPSGKKPHAALTADAIHGAMKYPTGDAHVTSPATTKQCPLTPLPRGQVRTGSEICQAIRGNGYRALIVLILIVPTMGVKIKSRGPCGRPAAAGTTLRQAKSPRHSEVARSRAIRRRDITTSDFAARARPQSQKLKRKDLPRRTQRKSKPRIKTLYFRTSNNISKAHLPREQNGIGALALLVLPLALFVASCASSFVSFVSFVVEG